MLYLVRQDVFDKLPQDAQDVIQQEGTTVSDDQKAEEIQEIADNGSADNEDPMDGSGITSVFSRAKDDVDKNGLK